MLKFEQCISILIINHILYHNTCATVALKLYLHRVTGDLNAGRDQNYGRGGEETGLSAEGRATCAALVANDWGGISR